MAKPPAKTKAASSSSSGTIDELPEQSYIDEQLQRVVNFSSDDRFVHTRDYFLRLKKNVPQVLLLEGGSQLQRLDAAHFWALSLNCSSPLSQNSLPCCSCQTCSRMVVHMHRDFFYLDGSKNSIKIDDVRSIKSCLGEPPREATWRIILFREAQAMAAPAANALLKVLEEPQPATTFVMLTPQRERLLPTLVSRSMVLTLPWPNALENTQEVMVWAVALCKFIVSGKGWFAMTSTKGAVDASSVYTAIGTVRYAMTIVLGNGYLSLPHKGSTSHHTESDELLSELAKELSKIPFERLRYVDEVLAEAQDCTIIGANPSVTLDWLATRLFLLVPR